MAPLALVGPRTRRLSWRLAKSRFFLDQFPGMDGTLCVYYQNLRRRRDPPGLLVQLGLRGTSPASSPCLPPMVARARRVTETPASPLSAGEEGSGEVFGSHGEWPGCALRHRADLVLCPAAWGGTLRDLDRPRRWPTHFPRTSRRTSMGGRRRWLIMRVFGMWTSPVYESGKGGGEYREAGEPRIFRAPELGQCCPPPCLHPLHWTHRCGASVDSNVVRIGGVLTAPPPDPEAQVPWPARPMEGLGGNPPCGRAGRLPHALCRTFAGHLFSFPWRGHPHRAHADAQRVSGV